MERRLPCDRLGFLDLLDQLTRKNRPLPIRSAELWQAEEYKHIKKVFMTFIVVAVLGGGYMTKTTIDNSSKQASAMAEIVKAIQESSTKINKGK